MELINFCLACGLFYLNTMLGKLQYGYRETLFKYGKFSFDSDEEENLSGNFFLKIINPTIFMAISCAVMQHLGKIEICNSLWMLVPMFWLLRIVYMFFKNILRFMNTRYEIFAAISSLLLAEAVFYLLIMPLIKMQKSVFVPIEDLRNSVWFVILAYVAKTFWDICKMSFNAQAVYPADKRRAIIFKQYDYFSKKYGKYILSLVNEIYPKYKEGKGEFICLVYAIMIFEDYNRPKYIRAMENATKKIWQNREMTLGIMQVKSNKLITDMESIDLAIRKLFATYLETITNNPVEHAITDYNNGIDYQDEVKAIYDVLTELLTIDLMIEDIEAFYKI